MSKQVRQLIGIRLEECAKEEEWYKNWTAIEKERKEKRKPISLALEFFLPSPQTKDTTNKEGKEHVWKFEFPRLVTFACFSLKSLKKTLILGKDKF